MERRLAAILAADVVGYSRLMEADEEATARTLSTYREIIEGLVASHHGRVFGSAGDSVIAEFASPVEAVRCAVDIQRELEAHNVDLSEDRRMRFRIGVNLGDVMVKGDDLLGDGVNIAARLEGLADPGGIYISGTVFDQVEGKLDLSFDDLGAQEVKNIAKPVRVYRVRLDETGSANGVSASTALALPDKPSIAVMPFTNISNDPEQDYFSDGLTNDITTDLSKFRNLFVIAAHSTFTYKGKSVKVQEIGRDLGVRYILEGSVQRTGDRVRINAQLIDATTGQHLWAERYNRRTPDLFTIQDEIIETIVATLPLKVEDAERDRSRQKPLHNFEAYDYYLQGRDAMFGLSNESNLKAQELLERAIELDPTFARAYVQLAWVHIKAVRNQWSDKPENSEALAMEMALKAHALDPADAICNSCLGAAYLWSGQRAKAITMYEKARALNPNDAHILVGTAIVLYGSGRAEEAISLIDQAMRINPHYPEWYLGDRACAFYKARRYEDALATFQKMRDPIRSFREVIAATYIRLGRIEEARNELAEFYNDQAELDYVINDMLKDVEPQ